MPTPTRHSVVAEAVKGWRKRAPAPRQANALDLAIIGVLPDGGLQRFEAAALTWRNAELWSDGTGRLTVRKGKNQTEPQMIAVTTVIARALGESDPRMLTRGADREPGRRFQRTQWPHRHMAHWMAAAGAPNAAVQRQSRWKQGNMVADYTRGEMAGEALKWMT